MSSAVISTTAAQSRPFVFDEETDLKAGLFSNVSHDRRASLDQTAEGGCPHMVFQSIIKNQQSTIPPILNRKSAIGIPLVPASRLGIRPAPEMVSCGIPALDALTGGLPRGCLTEICGPASSGRTTVFLSALAAAARRGEFCVVVDASDALDPQSVAAAGVDLGRLLWVRCGKNSARKENRLEQVLRATDLLLESGGFGLIVLDLGDLPWQATRRIPLATWFRFRRAIEHTPTILLAIEQQAIAGSCSSQLLQLGVLSAQPLAPSSNRTCLDPAADRQPITTQELKPTHSHLLTGLEITVELIRSRVERKPARSVILESKTAWTG